MKNAVIYARGNDAIGISIPSQIFLCKRFAVNNNYTVVKVFTDNNASEKVKDRPFLQKLFNGKGNPEWDTVIIFNRSCLFVDLYKYIKYMQELNLAGKRILTAIEQGEILL